MTRNWLRHLCASALLVFVSLVSQAAGLRILVLGAGPAGLATAVTLRLQGHEVLVVEKRGILPADLRSLPQTGGVEVGTGVQGNHLWGSRERVILLDEIAFDLFDRLGLEPGALQRNTFVNFIYRGPKAMPQAVSFNSGTGLGFITSHAYPGRQVAGTAAIRDLELALLKRYLSLGGKIHFGSTLEDAPGFRPDYTIVAEGARSTTLEKLGIYSQPVGFPQVSFVVGTYELETPLEGAGLLWNAEPDQRLPYTAMAIVHGRKLTVYGTPTRTGEGFNGATPEQVSTALAARLRIHGQLMDADAFEIVPGQAAKFVSGHLLVIGDAAHKTDPSTGQGTSLAFQDSRLVGKFFEELPQGEALAEAHFVAGMQASVELMKSQVRRAWLFRNALSRSAGQVTFNAGVRLLQWWTSQTPLTCDELFSWPLLPAQK